MKASLGQFDEKKRNHQITSQLIIARDLACIPPVSNVDQKAAIRFAEDVISTLLFEVDRVQMDYGKEFGHAVQLCPLEKCIGHISPLSMQASGAAEWSNAHFASVQMSFTDSLKTSPPTTLTISPTNCRQGGAAQLRLTRSCSRRQRNLRTCQTENQ